MHYGLNMIWWELSWLYVCLMFWSMRTTPCSFQFRCQDVSSDTQRFNRKTKCRPRTLHHQILLFLGPMLLLYHCCHKLCALYMHDRNAKTFRPKKNTPVGSKGLQLKRHIEATLGSGNLMDAVRLPPGEDLNEWLAVNTVLFYNAVSVLYSTLDEFCTASCCEVMSAGSKYEYLWADGVKQKKPVSGIRANAVVQ